MALTADITGASGVSGNENYLLSFQNAVVQARGTGKTFQLPTPIIGNTGLFLVEADDNVTPNCKITFAANVIVNTVVAGSIGSDQSVCTGGTPDPLTS